MLPLSHEIKESNGITSTSNETQEPQQKRPVSKTIILDYATWLRLYLFCKENRGKISFDQRINQLLDHYQTTGGKTKREIATIS